MLHSASERVVSYSLVVGHNFIVFVKFCSSVGKKGKKWGEVECFSIFVLVQVCNDFFYWRI